MWLYWDLARNKELFSMKQAFLFFVAILQTVMISASNLELGDAFVADNITYMVTSISPLEVQVGDGKSPAIDEATWGNIEIPSSVNDSDGNTYSVTAVGRYAFRSRKISSVSISAPVKVIEVSAFRGCENLYSISFPNSLTTIKSEAFVECHALKAITIPKSVTSIISNPFRSCSGLASIIVEDENPEYDSRNNCNAIIKTKQNELVIGCKNTVIPPSVTSLGESSFFGCSGLTIIDIPNSVKNIKRYAFYYCSSLASITIPSSVNSIGENPFARCRNLSSVYVDADNSYFDSRENCYAVINTKNNEIVTACKNTIIPSSVTSIGKSAFYGSTIKSISIPNSVTKIGEIAFCDCKRLISVDLPNSLISIGRTAFQNCSGLTTITIPDKVTQIEDLVFSWCSNLSSITLPSTITSIGYMAFYDCERLKSISIPGSVTNIGESAFAYCGLSSVTSEISVPFSIKTNVFTNYNIPLYIPFNTKAFYETTDGWKEFKNIIELDKSGIKSIPTNMGNKEPIYNLQGQQIENPTKGIFIRNKKKVFIKN